MSDAKTLSDRIDALETRLTFQDETIETLNKTITAQWLKIDALTRQVAELKERLQDAESNATGPGQRTAAALLTAQKKNGLRKGGRSFDKLNARLLAVAVDDDLAITIVIAVAIVAALDHDGLAAIAIAILTLTDHFTVAITVAMTGTYGHAHTRPADTNADLFRTRRLNQRNSSHRDGSHYKMLDHRMFLSMKFTREQFARM